jgi:hypothetical protein
MDIKLTLIDLLGTNQSMLIMAAVGLILALLAFLPGISATFISLLGLLPIRESVIENAKKTLQTSNNWPPATRRVLGVAGVIILLFDGWVFFASTPMAIGEERSIPQGASLSINVLDNERDARTIQLSLASYDPRSDHGGTITCEGPVCTYLPPASFSGDDSFYYIVNFAGRGTAGARVLIHVLAPTQTPLPPPTNTPTPTLNPTPTLTPTPSNTFTSTPVPASATPPVTPSPVTPSFTPTGSPTITPTPIVTPPAATPTITSTITPTPTSPPSVNGEPYLITNGNVFVRPWPKGKDGYGYLTVLEDGTRARILGRNGSESDYHWWWQIECPQGYSSTTGCWISSDYVDAHNAESVPLVPDPPTPTPKG